MQAKILLTVAASLSLSACAFQPVGLLYSNVKCDYDYPRPWAYSDLSYLKGPYKLVGHTTGAACSNNILGLFATGDRSNLAAYEDALARAGGNATIVYDVKIDHTFKTYLGLYSVFCTQLSGIAARVEPPPPSPPRQP